MVVIVNDGTLARMIIPRRGRGIGDYMNCAKVRKYLFMKCEWNGAFLYSRMKKRSIVYLT